MKGPVIADWFPPIAKVRPRRQDRGRPRESGYWLGSSYGIRIDSITDCSLADWYGETMNR